MKEYILYTNILMKNTKEEIEATEIFIQFDEDTKTRFVNTRYENLNFTKSVFKFISEHDVNYIFEDCRETDLENDFECLCGFSENEAKKATRNVLLFDEV